MRTINSENARHAFGRCLAANKNYNGYCIMSVGKGDELGMFLSGIIINKNRTGGLQKIVGATLPLMTPDLPLLGIIPIKVAREGSVWHG